VSTQAPAAIVPGHPQTHALQAARLVLSRDLRLAFRRPGELVQPLIFFAIVATLFPLAITPEKSQLVVVAPGVVWVAALLAVAISLHRLFEPDLDDGVLEQWLLSPHSLTGLVALRIAAHWLVCGLPLVAVGPLLALQYGLSPLAVAVLLAALLLGTPTLSLLGALGAALTLGLRGHVLVALIVLPLCVPVLVFGSSAVSAGQQGLPVGPHLSLLGACLSLAAFLCPWATGAALRLAVE